MLKHLKGNIHVFHFASQAGCCYQPREIAGDMEEVEVIISGRGNFTFDEKVYEVEPGAILWYSPGDVVVATSHKSQPYETIVFRFGVTSRQKRKPAAIAKWQSQSQCMEFCKYALTLCRQQGLPDSQDVCCVYARLFWEARDSQRQEARQSLPASVKLAMRFIQDNFRKELSVQQIADAADVSSSHLHLLFRNHTAASPMQHVISQRILAAQQLLMDTPKSVKQICHAVGFNDLKYFCTCFKRQTSYRPTEYRKRFST